MQTETTTLKVKVLKGLPLAIMGMGSQMFKLVETFSFLKAIYPEGRFSDVTKAAKVVSSASLISPKTFKRRISALIAENLVSKKSDGNYYLSSWEDVAARFQIRHCRFYIIQSSKHVKLEYILRNKAMQEKEAQCGSACVKRIRGNQFIKEMLEPVTGSIHPESVADHQLTCFLSEGKLYDQEAAFALSMRYHKEEEKIIRGDVAMSYRTLNRLFGFESLGGFAYWKKKLCQSGLQYVEKRRQVLKNGTNTTSESRRVRLGHVWYNRQQHVAELIMPDKIHHLPMKGLDDRFEKLEAIRKHLDSLDAKAAA